MKLFELNKKNCIRNILQGKKTEKKAKQKISAWAFVARPS